VCDARREQAGGEAPGSEEAGREEAGRTDRGGGGVEEAGPPVSLKDLPEEINQSIELLKPSQRSLHGSKFSLLWRRAARQDAAVVLRPA
jgi:hypothetical protein